MALPLVVTLRLPRASNFGFNNLDFCKRRPEVPRYGSRNVIQFSQIFI